MKIVLSAQTFVVMMGLSVVFSGCIDPYPNTYHYQSQNNRYVSPTPRYVVPAPVYAPQPQTKVIVVEQPRYRDSGRMDRYDHGSNYRDGSNRMDNRSSDTYRNNSSRMDLQPQPMGNHSGDNYRNSSIRIDNRSNPMQPRIDNRPIVQPSQPVIQPHIDNRPTFQPIPSRPIIQPLMDNHFRRDNNSSTH